MRFISKYGRFALLVRRHEQEAFANGAVRVIQQEVTAYFEPNRLRPLEREMAVAHWFFNGSMQEADEATTYPPDYRIGVFDSEEAQRDHQWSDEIRIEVEQKLIENADRYGNVLVVRSNVPAPWPRYDEYSGTPQSLVRKLVEDGHSLDAVLTYERDNQNRPKVVDEIEKAISAPALSEEPLGEEILG